MIVNFEITHGFVARVPPLLYLMGELRLLKRGNLGRLACAHERGMYTIQPVLLSCSPDRGLKACSPERGNPGRLACAHQRGSVVHCCATDRGKEEAPEGVASENLPSPQNKAKGTLCIEGKVIF